tara:strand:+ start:1019 stop:1327 length:309 start_codon:yes stop_codon:yes gene_type:complete
MEKIKKNIICSSPFSIWPTIWEAKLNEDVKSSPDLTEPDLINVSVTMIEEIEGGSKKIEVTKNYPIIFKDCIKFKNDTKFIYIDDVVLNELFITFGFSITVV